MVFHPIFHARTRNRFPRRRLIRRSIQGLMLRRLVCFALISSLFVLPGDCLPFKEMRVLASAVEDLTAPALALRPSDLEVALVVPCCPSSARDSGGSPGPRRAHSDRAA